MGIKCKTFFNACKQLYVIGYQRYCRCSTQSIVLPFLSSSFWFDPYSLYEKLIKSNLQTKTGMNWMTMTTMDIVEHADKLYEDGEYLEVYEMLNRIKYDENPEIQWRVCRVLFKISADPTFIPEMREEMITEAFILINLALTLEENNPYIYKWSAIITDAKCEFDGLLAKIRSYETIKTHLEKAIELQPNDMTTLYILGKWCYEMSRLTRFQRFIAKILYQNPPYSTYEEAYKYLSKSAELQKTEYYIPLYYVLGKTCLKLKQFFRARYYLYTVTTLLPRSQYEEVCVKKAKALIVQLDKYDLDKDSILHNLHFTHM